MNKNKKLRKTAVGASLKRRVRQFVRRVFDHAFGKNNLTGFTANAFDGGIIRQTEFAWLPKRISRLSRGQASTWIIPTGRTVWFRRTIHCIGLIDEWYELPNPRLCDTGNKK